MNKTTCIYKYQFLYYLKVVFNFLLKTFRYFNLDTWIFYSQFMIDTPVTPITSIAPLVFVISVTAVKQVSSALWMCYIIFCIYTDYKITCPFL